MANAASRSAMQKKKDVAPDTIPDHIAFTISRDAFREVLAAVAPVVPSRSTLPVLSNVRLTAGADGRLTVAGTDLDLFVSVSTTVDVTVAGSITLPAKRLVAIAKELPPAPVTVRSSADTYVKIECGRAKFKLLGLPASDWPSFPKVDFASSWTLTAGDLQQMIKQTAFAVSTEDSRPILNGVLWQRTDVGMRMVATNGHRLARITKSIESLTAMFDDLIVPPRALDQATRLLASDDAVDCSRAENHLGFRTERVEIYTRLIEGPYPNYAQVIPGDLKFCASIDRVAMIHSLKRIMPMAPTSSGKIAMDFTQGEVRLFTNAVDIGEGSDYLPVRWDGEAFRVGFDARYLLEILNVLASDEIAMRFTGSAERAVILTKSDGNITDDQMYLIMPQRLQD